MTPEQKAELLRTGGRLMTNGVPVPTAEQAYTNPNANYNSGTDMSAGTPVASPQGIQQQGANAAGTPGSWTTNPITGRVEFSSIVSPTIANATASGITRTSALDEYKAEREKEKAALAEEARIQRAAIIDAINTRYGAKSARTQQAGDEALASQRSINLRAGLGGSDFGVAAKAEVKGKTKEALDVVDAEKAQELNTAIMAIEGLTLKKEEAARLGRQDEETFIAGLKKSYTDVLGNLKKAGTTVDKLKKTETYQDMLDAGMSDIEIDAMLKPDAKEYTYQVLSDGRIARFDKTSGGDPEFFNAPANLKNNAEVVGYKDGIYQQTPEVDADGNITGWKLEKLQGFAADSKSSISTSQAMAQERNIRKDFNAAVASTKIAENNIAVLNKGYEEAKLKYEKGGDINAAGQAIVVAFNKALDPTSVVRETEYNRTPEGQDLFSRAKGLVIQIQQGGPGLTMENLESLRDMSMRLLEIYKEQQLENAQIAKLTAEQLSEETGGQYGDLRRILPQSTIKMLEDSENKTTTETPSTGIKVKNISTGVVSSYDGTLTPAEAKAAGYEIVTE